MENLCRTCNNVADVAQGVKDVQQKGTRVEKFEKNFKKSSETQVRFYTWRRCVVRGTRSL